MADVYKAYQPGLDRYVAIKVLHPFLARQTDFLSRFQREARVVAMLRHPNIIQVYDFDYDVDDDAYYMVMELIEGPTLKARLQEASAKGILLPFAESAEIAIAIANALAYAHQRGMVHRDIKPANIMFGQDGQPILADFGIAKMVDISGLTASGTMVGTPAYMSPEQGMGQTGDERSDIYSLGVVLYQLATGQLPFEADTFMGVVLKHINEAPTPPGDLRPGVPPSIQAAITKAMAKNPEDRYQTASEFASDLRQAVASLPSGREQVDARQALPVDVTVAMATPPPARSTGPAMATILSTPEESNGDARRAELVRAPTKKRRRLIALVIGFSLVVLIAAVGALGAATRTDWPPGDFDIHQVIFQLPFKGSNAATATGAPPTPRVIRVTATLDEIATGIAHALATYSAEHAETPFPTQTPSPSPSATPNATATALALCVFEAEVNKTSPAGSAIMIPGQAFVETWEITNTGTCTWSPGPDLTQVSGDEIQVIGQTKILSLAPGEIMELEVKFVAPEDYAAYEATWRLQIPGVGPFGDELVISCRVGSTPTSWPQATATPSPTPTPEFTPTPAEPLRVDISGLNGFEDLLGGEWHADVYVSPHGGTGEYRYYINGVDPANEFQGPSFEVRSQKCRPWVGTFIVVSDSEQVEDKRYFDYPGSGCP